MDLLNKYVSIGLLIVYVALLCSCRKEIEHIPGENYKEFKIEDTIKDPTDLFSGLSWSLMSKLGKGNFRAIKSFNRELYIGGVFDLGSDMKGLVKVDEKGDVIKVFNNDRYSNKVNDLFVNGDRLYIGGDFWHKPSLFKSFYDFMAIDDKNNEIEIPLFSISWSFIKKIDSYDNGIVILGDFKPGSGNKVESENVDLIKNNKAIGMPGFPEEAYSSTVYNNELHVIGEHDNLMKWNEGQWKKIDYYSSRYSDKLRGIASYEAKLYLLGNFFKGGNLQVMEGDGSWSLMENVSVIGDLGEFSGIKVIDELLFIYGSGITLDGNLTSNVICFDGKKWRNVGGIKESVQDITMFNGKYIIATKKGVYELI